MSRANYIDLHSKKAFTDIQIAAEMVEIDQLAYSPNGNKSVELYNKKNNYLIDSQDEFLAIPLREGMSHNIEMSLISVDGATQGFELMLFDDNAMACTFNILKSQYDGTQTQIMAQDYFDLLDTTFSPSFQANLIIKILPTSSSGLKTAASIETYHNLVKRVYNLDVTVGIPTSLHIKTTGASPGSLQNTRYITEVSSEGRIF